MVLAPLTDTVTAVEAADVQLPLTERTVNVPAVLTFRLLPVVPVLQIRLVPVADRVTESPVQKPIGPLAVITGTAGLITETVTAVEAADVQLPEMVCKV